MPIIGEVAGSQKTVPGAPGIVSATDVGTGRAYNNGAVTVVLSAPTYTGRLPITSYTVTPSSGSASSGASTTQTVTGLLSATNYTFTAYATNAVGNSPTAGPTGAVLVTTVPATPGAPSGTPGNNEATISWSAPANGGKTITGYTVTSSPGSITASTTGTSVTVTGLTNGTAYTFTVYATNANGNSATSPSSPSITPVNPIAKFFSIVNTGEQMYGAASDSTATYTIGNLPTTGGGTGRNLVLFSYSKTGTLNWQRQITSSSSFNMFARDVAVDSSGNIYAFCIYQDAGATSIVWYIAKFTSAGALTWQRNFQQSSGAIMNAAYSIEIDSSNNIYLGGGKAGPGPVLMKMDTSGNVVWARQGFNGYLSGGCFAAIDSSGTNIYAISPEIIQIGKDAYQIGSVAKYNSSGTPSRRQTFGSAGVANIAYPQGGGVVDSAGTVYLIGYRNYLSQFNAWIYKLNSTLGGVSSAYFAPNTSVSWRDAVIDSSDNIYTLGSSIGGGYGTTVIAKWNTSLTLQWQRTITVGGAGYSQAAYKIGIDNNNNRFIVTGIGSNQLFSAYLPTDGSGTGSYTVAGVSVTYAAGGYTTSTVSDTGNTGSAFTSVGTQGMSSAVPSHGTSTPTYTVSITTF